MTDSTAEIRVLSDASEDVKASVKRIRTLDMEHHSKIGPEVLKLHDEGKWASVYPQYKTWGEFVSGEFNWSRQHSYRVMERDRTAAKLGLAGEEYPTYKEAAKLSRVPDAVSPEAFDYLALEATAPHATNPDPTSNEPFLCKIVQDRASEPIAAEAASVKITTRSEPRLSREENAFLESIAIRDDLKTDRSRAIFDADALAWFRAKDCLEIMRKRGIGKTRDGQIIGDFHRPLRRLLSIPAPHAWLVCCARDDASETCNGGYFPSGHPCDSCGKTGYVL